MRTRGDQSTRTSMILVAALALVAMWAPLAHSRVQPLRTVVVVKDASGDNRPEAFVRSVGGRVLRPLGVIDGFIAAVPQVSIGMLGHAPGVRSATPNRRLSLQAQYGQDSGVASAVYTDVVRASKTWGAGHSGAGGTGAVGGTGGGTPRGPPRPGGP